MMCYYLNVQFQGQRVNITDAQWGHDSQVWHEYGCSEMRLMKEYSSNLHIRSLRKKKVMTPNPVGHSTFSNYVGVEFSCKLQPALSTTNTESGGRFGINSL